MPPLTKGMLLQLMERIRQLECEVAELRRAMQTNKRLPQQRPKKTKPQQPPKKTKKAENTGTILWVLARRAARKDAVAEIRHFNQGLNKECQLAEKPGPCARGTWFYARTEEYFKEWGGVVGRRKRAKNEVEVEQSLVTDRGTRQT